MKKTSASEGDHVVSFKVYYGAAGDAPVLRIMTQEERKTLKVGDALLYTNRDKGIINHKVYVHPWDECNTNGDYVWVTTYVVPIHRSELTKIN